MSERNHNQQSQYTIRFALDKDNPVKGENLWAEKVGPDLYRLCTTPFFAQGYAGGDVVRCTQDQFGILHVERMVEPSSNNAIHVYFEPGWDSATDKILSYLTYIGCTFETSGRHYAFDVPNEPELKISLKELAAYLNELEKAEIISWEVSKWPKEML
jgi:hypothetical protein